MVMSPVCLETGLAIEPTVQAQLESQSLSNQSTSTSSDDDSKAEFARYDSAGGSSMGAAEIGLEKFRLALTQIAGKAAGTTSPSSHTCKVGRVNDQENEWRRSN